MLQYFKDLNQSTSVVMKSSGIFGKRKAVSIEAKKQKRRFIDDYLQFDGVFVLRMVSILTSEVVGTELLHELWKKRAVYKDLYFYENNQNELYLQYDANDNKRNFDDSGGDRNNNIDSNRAASIHRGSRGSQAAAFFKNKMDNEDHLELKKASTIKVDKDKINFLKNNRYAANRSIQNSTKSSLKLTKSENSLLIQNNENNVKLPLNQSSPIISNQNNSNEPVKALKAKKVVFASSVEHGFSDIESVFSDLNIDK